MKKYLNGVWRLKMYNHEYYEFLKNKPGITIREIVELSGRPQTQYERSLVARKMRVLVKYKIVRVEKIPDPEGSPFQVNSYYLIE